MAEVGDATDRPGEGRRRIPRWAAIALLLAVVALVGLGIVALLAGDDEGSEAQWEECAAQVDPPADRAARLDELSEAEDVEAARQRLADEIREVDERITA